MPTFIGFGSYETGPVRLLHDNDLIKKDLLNHFMTHKGERVMDMNYGFIGWDLIFELQQPGVKSLLENDARRIIGTEPRVAEKTITVTEEQNGYVVSVELYFLHTQTVETLSMFFKNKTLSN